MISLTRSLTCGFAALVMAAGAVVVTSGTAEAAAYNGVCGSGYSVIDSENLTGGTVFLTYNASTGKNCVVTVRNNPGTRMYMDARVSLAWDTWNDDPGNFSQYAGPVYVAARHQCIDWGGTIGSSSVNFYETHCG